MDHLSSRVMHDIVSKKRRGLVKSSDRIKPIVWHEALPLGARRQVFEGCLKVS